MSKHALTWVVIFGVIAMMFVQLPQMAARQDAVLNTYRALVEVDALAKQHYVEPIEDDRLVEGAIRGMMLALDPYSGYIAQRDLAAFERRTHGDYIGVGVEVGIDAGQLTVIAPIDGSPAAVAGIMAGDVILAIDDRDLDGLSVFDAEEMLAGQAGTNVRLRVQHTNQNEPTELKVLRGPVVIGAVRGFGRNGDGGWGYMIDPVHRIGYVRVSSFHDNTMREFDAALEELRGQQVRGLIIDLRFNPGGLLHQAVAMVDRFIVSGLIVSTVTRRRAVEEYAATEQGTIAGLPLAVLVNGASASSAEIVAGSLQDHGRAVIVGERTFGKGSVQHLIHLTNDKAAVMLTGALYRLPNGRIIHRGPRDGPTESWGVMPDIEVPLSKEETRTIQSARKTVDASPAHGPESSAGDQAAALANMPPAPSPQILRDRQLAAALSSLSERVDSQPAP